MNPFNSVIDIAREWVMPHWKFVELQSIQWVVQPTRGGLWYPPTKENPRARIECGWDESVEILWHEVFHSVFHGSPMMQYDPLWCEGWCNAFADVHHRHFQGMPPDTFRSPESHNDRYYTVPALLILAKANFCPKRLRDIWCEWNQFNLGHELRVFSEKMGYNPESGYL